MSASRASNWTLSPATDWTLESAKVEFADDLGKLPPKGWSVIDKVLTIVSGCLKRGESVEVSSVAPVNVEYHRDRVVGHAHSHWLMTLQPPSPAQGGGYPTIGPDDVLIAEGGRVTLAHGFAGAAKPIPPAYTFPRAAALAALHDDPFVQRTMVQIVKRLPEIIQARRQALTEKQIESMVDLYLADDPLSEARADIAMDNARERARFVSDVACLNSKQVAEYAGHQAANASVTGSRWKQQGKVFSVPWKGAEIYPAFQFRDGQPKPVIAKILRELPERYSPWQTAFWFTSENGWLEGAAPVDRLDQEDAVVAAARHESEPIIG